MSIQVSLALALSGMVLGQPPGPDAPEKPNQGSGNSGNDLLDQILKGTDEFLNKSKTPGVMQPKNTPPAPDNTPQSSIKLLTAKEAPKPEDIKKIAKENRQAFGINIDEKDNSKFFHPDYGECYEQIDGSYFFPDPKSKGEKAQPFTVRNWKVEENSSKPIAWTKTIHHFKLKPLNNWMFIDNENLVYFLQIDGTIFDLGVKTDGTKIRKPRTLEGKNINETRTKPLPWTVGVAELGLYPLQNVDGSFSKPNDPRKYYIQADSSIFKEKYFDTNGVELAGVTFASGDDALWKWRENKNAPLPSTQAIAALMIDKKHNAKPKENGTSWVLDDSPGECVVLSDGKIFYTGGKKNIDGKEVKYYPKVIHNNRWLSVPNEIVLSLDNEKEIEKLTGKTYLSFFPTRSLPTPVDSPIVRSEFRRELFFDSKRCMRHNPDSPFLHGPGPLGGSYKFKDTDFYSLERAFRKEPFKDLLLLKPKSGDKTDTISDDEAYRTVREYLEKSKEK